MTLVVLFTACGMVAMAEESPKTEAGYQITAQTPTDETADTHTDSVSLQTEQPEEVDGESPKTGDTEQIAVAGALFTLTFSAFVLCRKIRK